jgi:fatty-acyl-CoA synthase
VTGAPNFGYALGARALSRTGDLDLSSIRIEFNGAEPIDPATVEWFNRAGAAFGLDPGAMFCVYGLAEATLAVTFPEVGRGLATDVVEGGALEHDGRALPAPFGSEDARRLPLLGRAVPGLELRISDPVTGAELPGRTVGEIEVRGSSVTPGYYRHPEATRALFRGGWLRTGDLGYMAGGELVVCGRMKDVIIVGGRKVFPQDVERAAGGVEGIRAGNVVAFGTTSSRGRESVVVVAETRSDDHGRLRGEVARRVRSVVGLSPADVVLVPPGTIPKTSSGKLQRSACRDRYLADRVAGSLTS